MAKRFRRYSTSLKVVLILCGAIGIGYFAKLFTGKKQVILADTVAENHPPKKHKRKHKVKNHLPKTITPTVVDTVAQAVRVVVKPEPVKQAEVAVKAVAVKSRPDSSAVNSSNTFLYTTYVQPNVTGVVKMRQQDSFYADIIADIPANAKVQVLKKGQLYYKVSYNNNIGFVPKWVLHAK
jgi:hypothetical protein